MNTINEIAFPKSLKSLPASNKTISIHDDVERQFICVAKYRVTAFFSISKDFHNVL